MKTTLAERLREARKAADMTQKSLGDAVGVSQAAIQKIETGKASQTTKLLDLANALKVRPEWLSSGHGAMREDDQQKQSISPKNGNSDVFRLDVLDILVSAGPGIVNQEFVEILHSVEYAPAEARHMFDGRKAENIRIINVRGDSMSGTIEPGDLLFVDISVKSFDGDGIYAFLYDDTAHVKRLQKMKDKLLVISDNKIYAAWDPIEKDEMNRVFVFGKVIGSMPQTYRKHG
ncbi:TPA: S24 family peptidase [Raoultella ornithinolytica]|uniref:S24 family peptidase n=1 Tax=Raoultella ornithinolytica TaxID=54291 RepID=UPI0004DA596D|nr:helix-turn-helix transcriptional regulator [Raoultella ornithinolytica]KDV95757.1 helix-turn-helix family protein [Raoultella ornithinolytica 2-156-04_S1_C1]KDX15274.1 helix-turn-helix family protein [Raoultella ornithinolytica 2-156-04_S1_C2]HAV2259986.1 helix-turn-helix transcriptional regulator [Raoultella ornithinolytica]HCT9585331.1 helix-turn-helix transcriptional regulator [Raoultella ornithinolytica]HDV9415345.1 helix-turn-helix transcriptional regulator [Raoultella ornithinolytica]